MTALKRDASKDLGKNLYLSVNLGAATSDEKAFDTVNEIIGQHVASLDVRRLEHRAGGFDATYLLDIGSTADLTSLSESPNARQPCESLSIVNPGSFGLGCDRSTW